MIPFHRLYFDISESQEDQPVIKHTVKNNYSSNTALSIFLKNWNIYNIHYPAKYMYLLHHHKRLSATVECYPHSLLLYQDLSLSQTPDSAREPTHVL